MRKRLLPVCLVLAALLSEPAIGLAAETDGQGAAASPAEPAAETAKAERIAFIAVAGAPGDGEEALIRALAKRLAAAGVQHTSSLSPEAYSVEGIVKVTPLKGGRDSVRIDWTIFDPEGNTLGGVSQTRTVRRGALSRKWGAAADAAARAAAREIAKFLPKR